MIFKRLYAKLRAQDWMAITIEVVIVVIGVFLGTQVSNWNDDRLQRAETQRMLSQLTPQLQQIRGYISAARVYFGVTRAYAEVAEAGLRGDPRVSDNDFVIAAYQASQIQGIGTNGSAFATVLGADRLRYIDDPLIRADLSFLVSTDYSQVDTAAVNTPYRTNVRRYIPMTAQDLIRDRCGDRPLNDGSNALALPRTCGLKLPEEMARSTATTLRSHPELLQDLQWHTAAVASTLSNMTALEGVTNDLYNRLQRKARA